MADLEFCDYMTGIPHRFVTLLVGIETHPDQYGDGTFIQFYTDAEVHVDWGTGKYLMYPPGLVYGKQENPNANSPIVVRSYEEVKQITFGTQAQWDRNYKEIDVVKASHLTDATRMCYKLEEMVKFSFFGNNQIESFESAWEDCTELVDFEGMDTTRCTTMKRAWKNCNKLIDFPQIYAAECLTVEEAWMGCTAMIEFPLLEVQNCLNFDSAWRGNVELTFFPYIDTTSGTSFNYSWAYCTKLTYFPALQFSQALSMNYTFAYMKSIRNMPIINSTPSTSFVATFKQMCSLRCIAGVDSISIAPLGLELSNEMFAYTPTLIRPGTAEQLEIESGVTWLNPDSCFYDAGRSVFFVHIELTDDNYCTNIGFTVTGGDFEIDWGDGLYLPYNEGFISDIPINNGPINIRSEENVTNIQFHDDVMTHVEFKRAQTITDLDAMLKDFITLEYFEILGQTQATDYSDVLNGCHKLATVGEIHLANATTVARLFKDCYLIEDVGLRYYDVDNDVNIYDDIDMSSAITLDEMFYGCGMIEQIQKCITPIGQTFTRMFANTDRLNCIAGIDTRQDTVTTEMFYETPVLVRPTSGEQTAITAIPGILFDNLGNCGGPVAILFRTSGETTFQLDREVTVDWGDGNFVTIPANTPAVGTQVGEYATILGDGTTLDWTVDTLTEVTFVRVDNFTSMANMFEGHTTLTQFDFIADSYITDFTEAFKGSGLVDFVAPLDLSLGTLFTGMFEDTLSLNTVTAMNTLNGTDFEYMFAKSGLQCLKEVNTVNAQFPPSLLICANELVCADTIECHQRSTMFDSALPPAPIVPNFPTPAEIELILNHYHWVGTTPCEGT